MNFVVGGRKDDSKISDLVELKIAVRGVVGEDPEGPRTRQNEGKLTYANLSNAIYNSDVWGSVQILPFAAEKYNHIFQVFCGGRGGLKVVNPFGDKNRGGGSFQTYRGAISPCSKYPIIIGVRW